MEGLFDLSSLTEENPGKSADTVSIMYSGVVDMRYGIPELLDAMELLDDNCELWITGGGNAVPLVRKAAKTDPRIKFFGFLPSRKELLLKQKAATMLISTRRHHRQCGGTRRNTRPAECQRFSMPCGLSTKRWLSKTKTANA